MKKDYMPVAPALEAADETTLVEGFWSCVWQDHGTPPLEDIPGVKSSRGSIPISGACRPAADCSTVGADWEAGPAYYAARGFDAVGVDLSQDAVARCQARFPDAQFTQGDIRRTGLPSASFDAYFSWGTFEHFEEGLSPCIREAFRLLRPGGFLFVTVPFQNRRHLRRNRRRLWQWDEHCHPADGYLRPMRFYQWRLTREELRRELLIGGFVVKRLHPIHKASGLRRMLANDWRLPAGTLAHRAARRLIGPFIPSRDVAHMILGIAIKPQVS